MTKSVSNLTDGQLAAELKHLDDIHGSKDPNGRKKEIRREMMRRDSWQEVTGYPKDVILRNPLVRAEYEEFIKEGGGANE